MSGFGGVIKLTGEKDYLNALKRIRQSLRETASSLSAISSSFKDNTRDMDNTRKAAGKLRDILKKQSDDANNLRSSYEKMQKIFENNREEINKLKKSYKNAREELEKIEKQAGKASDQYKRQADEVKKLEQNLERETKKQQDNEVALSKMRTELNNSKTALNKTRGELEKTESALKNNAETVKKARSEYGKLKSTIEKQEGVLKKLKDQYKEVVLKEGDASEAAKDLAGKIKNLSDKLEDNKTKLKNVDDAAEKASGGLKGVGENAKKASDKFDIFKTALGNFISNVALRAVDKLKEIAIGAFNVGKAFEYSMAKVGAISGATGGTFTKLRDKAIEMGDSTIFTAQESAEAMKYMAIAGWRADEILAGIKPTLDLAAASGEDLAQVSDILTDTMTAFGISAQGSGKFADVLTAAALNANTNVGKMGETFKYVAPIANSLGYSIEDTAIAIGAIADSGIKESIAGTALRSIFSRLATNASSSKNKLGALDVLTKKLGVSFYDASGKTRPFIDVLEDARQAWQRLSETERVSYAKTIAGQYAMSGWLALMDTTPEKFNQIKDSIINSSGVAQRVATEMTDNVEGDVRRLKSRIETGQIKLSKIFEPETREVLSWLKDASNILQYLSDHSVEFKTALITIATGITVFTVAVKGAKIVSKLTKAIEGLWLVISGDPMVAIISGVIALATGFIYLWNNSEDFRNFWIDLWESMEESSNEFGEAFDFLREQFEEDWNDVGNFFENIKKNMDECGEDVKKTVDDMDKAIEKAFTEAWESVKEVWGNVAGWFNEKWVNVRKGVNDLDVSISKWFSEAWENVKKAWGNVTGWFNEKWEGIKRVFWEVKDYFEEKFSDAWKAIKNVFSDWGQFFSDLWGKIKRTFSNLGTKIGNAVGNAVKSGINYVIDLLEDRINSAIRLINGAISLINMIPGVDIDKVNYLRFPRLAKGGVLDNGARTVIAGEDGAEAIVPLEKNTKWISLVANQLQKQMIPSLDNNTNVQSAMRAQDEFKSLTNSFKQALSEMKVVMDEETFGKFVDRTVSDAIYD